MKNKIFILIIGLILLSSSVFGAVFNIEHDTSSYTGAWSNPLNYDDNDWDTYATSTTGSYYFNFTNPNTDLVYLIARDEQGDSNITINNTLDLDVIQIETSFNNAANYVKYSYYNGATWTTLKSTYTGAASINFYNLILEVHSDQEELLYYNFSVLGSQDVINDSAHNFNGDLTNFNNNAGEINGATVSGGFAEFDGTTNNIASNKDFVEDGLITNQITVAAWIKIHTFANGKTIAGQYRAKIAPNEVYGMHIFSTTGNAKFTISNSTLLADPTITANLLDLNTWALLVGTYNGTHACISKNAGTENCETLTGNINNYSNSPFTLGNRVSTLSQVTPLDGAISKVILYNRSLSQEEITKIYNNESVKGSILNYDFIKKNSTHVYDTHFLSDSTTTDEGFSLGEAIDFDSTNYISYLDADAISFSYYYYNDDNWSYAVDNNGTYYLNGIETDYINMYINSSQIGINSTGSYFDNSIDEVRNFNRIITPIEIYSLYHYNTLTPPAEYTVFYAQNIYSNVTYQDFTIGYKNLDTLETGSMTTTEGFIPLLLSDSVTYEINITSSDFATQINSSFDPTLENYTFQVYDNNSVLVYVYNEENNTLMDSINITMDYMINGFYNAETDDDASFYLTDLLSGLYEFKFSSTDYYNRYYYLNIINSNHYLLNAYLIDTDTGALRNFIAQCTGSAVRNATISVYKLIDGDFVTIAQRVTDYTGLAPFYLNPATTYKIIITTEDYTTFTSSITPSSSPIAFDLCGEGSAQPFNWTTLYDLFSYLIDEETLINTSIHTFNLETSSPSGSIVSFGLTANGTSSIVTGSPAGGSTSITVNLTNQTGTVPVTYIFNITGYDQYNFTKIFVIKSFEDIGNYSYTNIFEDYKDEIPTGWRYIIVTLIAVLLMTLLYKFLDPIINSFAGLFVFVTFVYFGWVSVVFLVPMGALLIVFYLSERGGF